jgi:uncharacterized repeat protein (TIGR01451 family)
MNTFLAGLAGVVGLVLAGPAPTQHPKHPLPPPAGLLFVRVVAPENEPVQFFPVGPTGQAVAADAVVGLRPGYVYRVQIGQAKPDGPDHARPLYPTFEVRGTLRLVAKDTAIRNPVVVRFSDEDLRKAHAGTIITRYYYLENPDTALPVQGDAEEIVEFNADSDESACEEARSRGRLLLIVRLGGRQVSAEELAAVAVPGTVLMPGQGGLGQAARPPVLPYNQFLWYDPIAGPLFTLEECFHDGGDGGQKLGIRADGQLSGLEPADAAIEYTVPGCPPAVCESTRVPICAPRFAAVRVETVPVGFHTPNPLMAVQNQKVELVLRSTIPTDQVEASKTPVQMVGSKRPTEVVNGIFPIQIDVSKTVVIIGMLQGVLEVGQAIASEDVTVYACHKLMLIKWVDPPTGHRVGDEVTFYLRFANNGTQPLTNVAISDSLSPRLEYVPGSARASREAAFTVTPNEAGSSVLRWEITGELQPGQTGVVAFRARIR